MRHRVARSLAAVKAMFSSGVLDTSVVEEYHDACTGVHGVRWRIAIHGEIPPETVSALGEIPGVKAAAHHVTAPENALTIVGDLLRGVGTSVQPQWPSFTRCGAKAALPLLREWVSAFLTPFQTEGISFALRDAPDGSAHLWWPTGSGKTLGAIVWALAAQAFSTVSVVRGMSKLQWRGEIERFTTLTPHLLEGETPSEIPASATWLLVNYEILPHWIEAIEKWRWQTQRKSISLILDESHRAKSHKRWGAIEEVTTGEADALPEAVQTAASNPARSDPPRKRVKFNLQDNIAAALYRLSRLSSRRLSTTRTPITDRPRDLWAQLDLIHPGEWGPFFGPRDMRRGFVWRYCAAAEGAFGGIDTRGKSNLPELRRRLATVASIIPDAVVNRELPPKRRQVLRVPIGDQVKAAGAMAMLKAAAKHGPTAILEAQLMEAAARKRRRIVEFVEQAVGSNEKVVVFTGRRHDCDDLGGVLRKKLKGCTVYVGHGGHSLEDRERARLAYMATVGAAVLVGTIDAWGESLNLQDTDLAILAMLPYTPGRVIQAEGRFSRLGQRRPVLIVYLVAEGTVDEHVLSILLGKLPAVEKAIGLGEVAGLGRELSGVDDASIVKSVLAKILHTEAA